MHIHELVDAHHHLWNPTTGNPDIGYVWLRDIGAAKPFGDPTAIQRNYLIDEFLAEPSDLVLAASVHVQADGAIPDPVAETRFIQHISDSRNFPIAIVGFVDLCRKDAEAVIARHRDFANFRGVRQILSRLDDRPQLSFAPIHYLRDAGWRERFSLLAEQELSFDLQIYPEQMAEAAEFLSRNSDIPVIIDHAGSPWDQSAAGIARWTEGMRLLSQLPQVSVKLSGFGMFDRNWNAESIRPLFRTIVEQFGFERMLFGSNFPVDKLMRGYPDLLADMLSLCRDASAAERAALFAGNARRLYRI